MARVRVQLPAGEDGPARPSRTGRVAEPLPRRRRRQAPRGTIGGRGSSWAPPPSPLPLGGELVSTARTSPGTSSNDDGGRHMGKGTVPAERSPGGWHRRGHRRPLPVLVLSAPPPAPRVSPLTPLPPNHARLVPAVARKGLGVRDMTHPGGKAKPSEHSYLEAGWRLGGALGKD